MVRSPEIVRKPRVKGLKGLVSNTMAATQSIDVFGFVKVRKRARSARSFKTRRSKLGRCMPAGPCVSKKVVRGRASGLSFNDNNSTGELKDDVENGYSGEVTLGQSVGALPGTRQGWQQSMRNRLSAGDKEMTFPVIAPSGANDGSVVIVDFIQVRIDNFRAGSANRQDEFDFQIIASAVSSNDFASDEEGLGINSVQGVRLTE